MNSACSTPGTSSRSAASQGGRGRGAVASRSEHKDSLSANLHFSQPSSSSVNVLPSVHSVRARQHFVTVHTLTRHSLTVTVDAKTRVHDVLWAVGEHLQVNDDRFFGIAFRAPSEGLGGDQPRNEYFFLDPAHKIFKYAPKQPRFAGWSSSSKTESRPLLVLYYRVRVYIDEVRLITCQRSLEHYYIQLRENLLDQWAGRGTVSEERVWEMAALAVRADKGDNNSGYFRAEHYFPLWVINERGLEYIRRHMPEAMADLDGMNRTEAMTHFCIEASRSPFSLNCHLYGLRRHKMDSVDNAVIGITANGIEMCDVSSGGERMPLRSFQWGRVSRLQFDKKKLSIQGVDGVKMALYAQNESKARYLLDLCRSVHQCLLVVQHSTAGPRHLQYTVNEKSVDRTESEVSNSTSGVISGRQSQADRHSEDGRRAEKQRNRHDTDRDVDSLTHQSFSTSCSERSVKSTAESETTRRRRRMGRTRREEQVDEEEEQVDEEERKRDRIVLESRQSSLESGPVDELNESKDDTLKADNTNWQKEMAKWEERDEERESSGRQDVENEDDAEGEGEEDDEEEQEEEEVAAEAEEVQRGVNTTVPHSDHDVGRPASVNSSSQTPSSFLSGSSVVSYSDPLSYSAYLSGSVDLQSHHKHNSATLEHPCATSPSYPTATNQLCSLASDLSYPSSSDSRRMSNDILSDYSMHQAASYMAYPGCSSDSAAPVSVSLHDLRAEARVQTQRDRAPIREPPAYIEAIVQQQQAPLRAATGQKPRWPTVAVSPEQIRHTDSQRTPYHTHSESRIDTIDVWGLPSVSCLESNGRVPGGGRFAKRPSRQSGAIARVQSMPAHYHLPPQLSHRNAGLDEIPSVSGLSLSSSTPRPSSSSISTSMSSTPTLASSQHIGRPKTRDPPSYERALELQQRCGVAAEARGQPSFPAQSNTPAQFAPASFNAEVLDSTRLRDLPMLRALWAESQHTMTSLESSTSSNQLSQSESPAPSVSVSSQYSDGGQSYFSGSTSSRRPASCFDLTQADPIALLYNTNLPRGSYVLDSALPQRIYAMGGSQQLAAAGLGWSSSQPQPRVLDLPPPPPYPENARKAPMVM